MVIAIVPPLFLINAANPITIDAKKYRKRHFKLKLKYKNGPILKKASVDTLIIKVFSLTEINTKIGSIESLDKKKAF